MAEWIWGEILSNGFGNQQQTGYSELTPDAGSPFRRVTFTDVHDIIRGNFILDRDNYVLFMDWYRNEIQQGTISFDYYDCRVDATRTARIIGSPTYSATSNRFTVNVTLSLEPVRQTIEAFAIHEDGGYVLLEDGGRLILDVGVTV